MCHHCGADLVHNRRPIAAVASPPTIAAPVTSTLKKCPFCAEEILSAAVVCKHCRRDLLPPKPVAKPGPRWGRILLVVGAILSSPIVFLYCGEDHQRFIQFSEQRDAWHRKCDGYIDRPAVTPAARACAEELTSMMAYAKRQGWD